VAFQKYTLRNSTIFNFVLANMQCVIIEIVIDCAFSDTIILIRIFNDWFLEVGLELKDLNMNFSLKNIIN